MPVEKNYKSSEKVVESDVDDEENEESAASSPDSDQSSSSHTTQDLKTTNLSSENQFSDSQREPKSPIAKRKVTFPNKEGQSHRGFDAGEAAPLANGRRSPPTNGHRYSSQSESIPIVQPKSIGFIPRPGFARKSPQSPSPSHQSALFDDASLNGKEVWHITAPVSVPISTITSISKRHLDDGEPVLQHQHLNYGFLHGPRKPASTKLLVPRENGQEYRSVKIGFSRVLHLQQTQPPLALEESMKSVSSRRTEFSIKSQRPGLRIRYQPPGFEGLSQEHDQKTTENSSDYSEVADDKVANAQSMSSKTRALISNKRTAEAKTAEEVSDRAVKRSRMTILDEDLSKKESVDGKSRSVKATARAQRASSMESSATSSDGEDETEDSASDDSSDDS